ncbi:transcription repressor OFP7-like [Ananas comosus]|uniref:Transcription repressor n=1 Tax=Ananas comosus TaxID=4615 RepID=A0A199UKV1_ANACO|nr:transcription repressor OFP7-like [Ananas comosus]OAY65353.1 Transcription repressor OFP6 [Ananas comosus]
MSPGAAKKRSTRSSLMGLGCGCKDAKSVSVSLSASDTSTATPRRPRHNSSSAETLTLPSTSSCSDAAADDLGPQIGSSASTPSFSGLLRELGELEQSVMSLPTSAIVDDGAAEERRKKIPIHRRVEEESVAVVKESEDPLGDFRRSMLQMIVEKEIVTGAELRELLRRFLALNSPHHHDLILRAFADIWDDVFAGYNDHTPDLIRHTHRRYPPPPPPPF